MRPLAVLGLVLLCACPQGRPPDPPEVAAVTTGTRTQALSAEPEFSRELSRETVLLSLVLTPDGRASFDAVRRKPVSYLGTRQPLEGADHTLEIRHASLARPIELPLVLGRPDEPEAPARHAWAAGGTVLRAPSFGPGTRIALRDANGELAAVEVRE